MVDLTEKAKRTKLRNKFADELKKVMPGYKWVIHRTSSCIEATGIQSSGFNRLSTLHVVRNEGAGGSVSYTVRSSGFGRRSPWLATETGPTILQALRNLQNLYAHEAANYFSHAGALKTGRINKNGDAA